MRLTPYLLDPPSTACSSQGAHHVDLMFSHPDDTPDIVEARLVELAAIRSWIVAYGNVRAALSVEADQ